MLILLLACASPTHLQYDHGRAFYSSFQAVQPDLARASAGGEVYPLNGVEAEGIRTKSVEATTTSDPQELDAPAASEE